MPFVKVLTQGDNHTLTQGCKNKLNILLQHTQKQQICRNDGHSK